MGSSLELPFAPAFSAEAQGRQTFIIRLPTRYVRVFIILLKKLHKF